MLKKVLSTAVLLLFVMSASAVAQVKIGYLNTQKVMSSLPETQQVQGQLQDFITQKQAELSQRATAYQDEVAAYEANRSSMTEQEINEREQELTDMMTALEEFDQSIRLQVQQKRQELLSPILTRMDNAISAVAEAAGLDFVLNKSINTGDSVIFYASQKQLDITQKVIDRLTSSSQ